MRERPLQGCLLGPGSARLYVPSINEATHPRCCDEGYPDGPGRASKQGGRVVGHHSEAFVGIDTSKLRNAIAIADGGRGGEVRYLGEFLSTEVAIRKLVAKLTAEIPASNVLL